MLRFWISDEVYVEDAHGSQILGRLARAPRFNAWMADVIRPFCGRRVLEIGSGTGNLTRRLVPRDAYVASDVNPLYLQTLRALTADRPYLDVTLTDVTRGDSFPAVPGGFDTVVCLNVIEHVDDDRGALENIRRVLAPGGRAIVLVPQRPGALRHPRRGARPPAPLHRGVAPARSRSTRASRCRRSCRFNRVGTPAWWLNGKLLRRRHFGLVQIAALNLAHAALPARRPGAALPAALAHRDPAAARGGGARRAGARRRDDRVAARAGAARPASRPPGRSQLPLRVEAVQRLVDRERRVAEEGGGPVRDEAAPERAGGEEPHVLRPHRGRSRRAARSARRPGARTPRGRARSRRSCGGRRGSRSRGGARGTSRRRSRRAWATRSGRRTPSPARPRASFSTTCVAKVGFAPGFPP